MGNTDSPRYSREHRKESDLTDEDGKEMQETHESKWKETPQAPWSVEVADSYLQGLTIKAMEVRKKHKHLFC